MFATLSVMNFDTDILILGNGFSSNFFRLGLSRQLRKKTIVFSPETLFQEEQISIINDSIIDTNNIFDLANHPQGGMNIWGGGLSNPTIQNFFAYKLFSSTEESEQPLNIDEIKKYTGVNNKSFIFKLQYIPEIAHFEDLFYIEKHTYYQRNFVNRFKHKKMNSNCVRGKIKSIDKVEDQYILKYQDAATAEIHTIRSAKLIVGLGALGNAIINSIIKNKKSRYPIGNHLSIDIGYEDIVTSGGISDEIIPTFQDTSENFYTFLLKTSISSQHIAFRFVKEKDQIVIRCLFDTGTDNNYLETDYKIVDSPRLILSIAPQERVFQDLKNIDNCVKLYFEKNNITYISNIKNNVFNFNDSAHYYGTLPLSGSNPNGVSEFGEDNTFTDLYFLGSSGLRIGSHVHPTLFCMSHSFSIGKKLNRE